MHFLLGHFHSHMRMTLHYAADYAIDDVARARHSAEINTRSHHFISRGPEVIEREIAGIAATERATYTLRPSGLNAIRLHAK